MGYESRVFVALKCELTKVDKTTYVFSITLSDMRLSKMWNGFTNLFTNKVDWKLCGDNDIDLTKDCYGNICTYTSDIQSVITFLEHCEEKEHYRRITPLLAMLKAYVAEDWDCDELILIHYGY